MSEKKEAVSETEKKPDPGKKKRSRLPLIIAVVALIGGGGGATWWMTRTPAAATGAEGRKEEPKKPAAKGIVNFEPFVVNLADPGAQHFLRINVRLVVDKAEEAEEIQKNEVTLMRLRSDMLELLTEQSSEHIVSADGKAALKKEIGERAHRILEPMEVADVLFSDLVVQY